MSADQFPCVVCGSTSVCCSHQPALVGRITVSELSPRCVLHCDPDHAEEAPRGEDDGGEEPRFYIESSDPWARA